MDFRKHLLFQIEVSSQINKATKRKRLFSTFLCGEQADYFPRDFTPRQKVELIESLVKEWHEKQMVQAKTSVQQKLKKTGRER